MALSTLEIHQDDGTIVIAELCVYGHNDFDCDYWLVDPESWVKGEDGSLVFNRENARLLPHQPNEETRAAAARAARDVWRNRRGAARFPGARNA